MYPCKRKTWESLLKRNRHIHSAEINRGDRTINLHLSAIPFTMKDQELNALQKLFRGSVN